MLKKAGARDVRYHEYKKQGHVIDDFAYFTQGFMDWLFAQKLLSPRSKTHSVLRGNKRAAPDGLADPFLEADGVRVKPKDE